MVALRSSTDLARYFAQGFELAKEMAKHSPAEVAGIYEALAAHLRSAAPMSLLAPPALLPDSDVLIDLGAGSVIRLRVLDGVLNMYVCEPSRHDVNVVLPEPKRAELHAALAVVR